MTEYRRAFIPGGTYFFTVAVAEREGNDLLVRNLDLFRHSVRKMQERHPFVIHAAVILPDHLHMVWQLPESDAKYSMRWSLIKAEFSRNLPVTEHRSASRYSKRERGIWQRRYWEHVIRDDDDLRRHVEYIHYNPVKHGHAESPKDWPHSSFMRYVERGDYELEWAAVDAVIRLEYE